MIRASKVRAARVPWLSVLIVICLSSCSNTKAVPAEFPTAPTGTFTIAVIPDTQHYRNVGDKKKTVSNPVFDSYVSWVSENIRPQRIAFVSHVGDIVDVNNREQWTVARRLMDRLHGKVPYGISVGNHDMKSDGDSSLFQEFFPASRYTGFKWYGGSYVNPKSKSKVSGNNANSFQIFSAGEMDFIIMHLECNAPDKVLAWVDEILAQHKDRRAIITSHMGLGPRQKPKQAEEFFTGAKGRMDWKKCHGKLGNTPQQMWDKCFKKHGNLFMICCGDQSRTQAMRQTAVGDHGNKVFELLSDYGSNGLRVMRFIPEQNRIEVRTWNPTKKELCTTTKIVAAENEHQFDLDYNMSKSKR